MRAFLSNWIQSVGGLIFPSVCVSCTRRLRDSEEFLCKECLTQAYEDPNPYRHQTCDGIILPDTVYFQDALWRFDAGGTLQNILHMLKYKGVGAIGVRLGTQLGTRLESNFGYQKWIEQKEMIYIASVPLHKKKLKIRGYNQAEKIAIGVSISCSQKMLRSDVLVRVRHTETQTHFSHKQRIKNMDEAFAITDSETIKGACFILIDDVFTTGSTTFACAEVIKKAGAKEIGVLTLAIA